MSIWSDLLAAIEAEAIAEGYTGTLAEVGIDQPYSAKLVTLLELRSKLAGSSPQAVTGTFWQATQPVSGSVSVSNFTDNGLTDTQLRASALPVSGTVELGATSLAALENTTVTVSNPTAVGLTDTQLRASALPVSVASSTASSTTSVASSATSTTLLALNTNRKYASFRNDSTSVAYVAKSATATTSSVYLLQPQGVLYFDDYTGIVTAIWVTANGFMQIEEGT